jgi:hypothetical protein
VVGAVELVFPVVSFLIKKEKENKNFNELNKKRIKEILMI